MAKTKTTLKKKKKGKTPRQLETEVRNKKADAVLELIKKGMSKRKALIDKKMGESTFSHWLNELTPEEIKEKVKIPKANRSRYACARDDRTELKFESIEEDYNETPKRLVTGGIDPAWVQLQKLKIDSKKWELSKLKPNEYGDKVEISGEQDITISFKEKS